MAELGNLQYGSVHTADGRRRAIARTSDGDGGHRHVDLAGLDAELFGAGTLDRLLAADVRTWRQVHGAAVAALANHGEPDEPGRPVLGFAVADYVDFYASEHHATNVGRIFRPNGTALPPNWKHLPIGYHGRAGTVVASGSPVVRPHGQRLEPDGAVSFGATRRLDLEAEVGFVVGAPSEAGVPVPLAAAEDHLFGVCLLNDWSARDLQAWEYVPLGPLLGKSFCTSVAAWITPWDALAQARTDPVAQDPLPLPYLAEPATRGLDLDLTVALNGTVVSRPPFAAMYWTPAQLVAHLTSNGASLRAGDLLGSGTVSGPEAGQRGCLLELTWGGTEPLQLPDGTSRAFLADGDEVVLTASAAGSSGPIQLAEVRGRIAAAPR